MRMAPRVRRASPRQSIAFLRRRRPKVSRPGAAIPELPEIESTMKVAFLFPGQGSQKAGMGADLAREFPAARRVFEEAEEALRLTANTQPATLATSIAALRAFESECSITPALAAGHSLGEYSALVAAGALSLADALLAVRERGRLMQEACLPGQGAMAALIGLEPAAVQELCSQASTGGEIAV